MSCRPWPVKYADRRYQVTPLTPSLRKAEETVVNNPEAERDDAAWRRWGPYVSSRQWGTVREDYSADGNAWDYFPFEMGHKRAYRWGEDGIFGISDDRQRLCFAPAFWNGQDRFLKEKFFGLSGHEGNHGEDVKEIYYHLVNVPSHAYMKALYKYPQRAFPYDELRAENRQRGREQREFELIETGIFDDDAYFDIVVEYAKAAPDDVLIRITALNRAKVAAPIHLLPTLWFRNDWSWREGTVRPSIAKTGDDSAGLAATHPSLGQYWLASDGKAKHVIFTENETDYEHTYGVTSPDRFVKDGFHRHVVNGDPSSINTDGGTKAAFYYFADVDPGSSFTVRLRLTNSAVNRPLDELAFDEVMSARAAEADRFYDDLIPPSSDAQDREIQQRAFAGLLWNKQYYNFDVRDWLKGDPLMPAPPADRLHGRNMQWAHLHNEEIMSMPDDWEYPWYAAWDLGFHVITLAMIDPDLAKQQLVMLTHEVTMHPVGQLPAYEWAFGDVNPPVHAWAAYRVFKIEAKRRGGTGDLDFLERVFQKLVINFTWWVNRKDVAGRNVFQGGFLGLDNIGVFDRSAQLPTGGYLSQADGTAWMGVYAINMLAIAVELAAHDKNYEHIANKFFQHFLYIADAINNDAEGEPGLWDPEDQFYYDQLTLPSGEHVPLRVRSAVGMIPIFAVQPIDPGTLEQLPQLKERVEWFIANRPELATNVASMDVEGTRKRRLMAFVNPDRLRAILRRLFSEDEFLSPHGLRMLSKSHQANPYVLHVDGASFRVDYEPAESTSETFGGNSNWRGPVWFPLNYLVIESLQRFHHFLGDGYTIEFPTGSGRFLSLWDISLELSQRLISLFRADENGKRPFQRFEIEQSEHWRDHVLFHEYFHGDTGEGLGASHQTGWTALVAKLIQQTSQYKTDPTRERP
jgi:hypothetical protein